MLLTVIYLVKHLNMRIVLFVNVVPLQQTLVSTFYYFNIAHTLYFLFPTAVCLIQTMC